jgi:hypothetical protein
MQVRVQQPKHPGTVQFVDGETNTVVNEVDAATLPDSIRFEQTRDGYLPVVKVVAFAEGEGRRLLAYGTGGRLLRSIVQFRLNR